MRFLAKKSPRKAKERATSGDESARRRFRSNFFPSLFLNIAEIGALNKGTRRKTAFFFKKSSKVRAAAPVSRETSGKIEKLERKGERALRRRGDRDDEKRRFCRYINSDGAVEAKKASTAPANAENDEPPV